MKTKPWPLIILAVIQIFTPITNILFNAWVLKVSPTHVVTWLFQRPALEVFEALCLMPIAGIAIFQMTRRSYFVFAIAMLWSIISNLRHWNYQTSAMSPLAIFLVYGFQIALVLYFLLPAVRTTYFNPRVRWWESKPRYELKVPARIQVSGSELDCTLLNISEGGAFAGIPGASTIESTSSQPIQLVFWVLSQKFSVSGRIVHTRQMPDGKTCHGIQFDHTPETLKQFKGLTQALVSLGFQDRSGVRPSIGEFKDWILTLLRTGKGWRPNVKV